jgi:hypothetical protein
MATIESQETDSSRAQRYNQVAVLLHQWMAEDGEYDQQVGELLDNELNEDAMRCHNDDSVA